MNSWVFHWRSLVPWELTLPKAHLITQLIWFVSSCSKINTHCLCLCYFMSWFAFYLVNVILFVTSTCFVVIISKLGSGEHHSFYGLAGFQHTASPIYSAHYAAALHAAWSGHYVYSSYNSIFGRVCVRSFIQVLACLEACSLQKKNKNKSAWYASWLNVINYSRPKKKFVVRMVLYANFLVIISHHWRAWMTCCVCTCRVHEFSQLTSWSKAQKKELW